MEPECILLYSQQSSNTVHTLSQINAFSILPHYFLQVHFNIILTHLPRSSEYSLFPRIFIQITLFCAFLIQSEDAVSQYECLPTRCPQKAARYNDVRNKHTADSSAAVITKYSNTQNDCVERMNEVELWYSPRGLCKHL
jgi:hypothetical protein